MSSKPSATAPRWGRYLLAGALLAVLVASGISAQLFATTDAPQSSSIEDAHPTLYAHGHRLRPLVEETGGVQTLNIYGPGGRIIAQATRAGLGGSQKALHLLADHLGSTRAILYADDNVVAHFEYGPHGETAESGVVAAEARYRYTGHPWDAPQGLYETPARSYDPTTGRFLGVDPRRQDASPYVYAGNNPVGYLDPTGGVRVPYFMKSGMKKSDRAVARSIAKLFEVHADQQIGASTTFKKSKKGGRSSVRKNVKDFLYGRPGENGERDVRKFEFNEKFFWIMGEEEGVPNDLYEAFTSARKQPGYESFANKIILLDFSGTKKSKDILTEFEAKKESALLIEAEIAYEHDGNNRIASGFKVDGSDLRPDQFQAHVKDEIVKKWPESPVGIDVSSLPEAQSSSLITGPPGSVAGSTSMPSAPNFVPIPQDLSDSGRGWVSQSSQWEFIIPSPSTSRSSSPE